MYRRFLHIALCASLLTGAALPTAAEAGHRYDRGYSHSGVVVDVPDLPRPGGYDRGHVRRAHERAAAEARARHRAEKRWHRRYRDRDDDDAGRFLAGAIIGLATGAIIAGATRPAPAPVYRSAPRGALEPWTPQWQAWCRDRYRSFNPATGFWRGYDGKTYFCRP